MSSNTSEDTQSGPGNVANDFESRPIVLLAQNPFVIASVVLASIFISVLLYAWATTNLAILVTILIILVITFASQVLLVPIVCIYALVRLLLDKTASPIEAKQECIEMKNMEANGEEPN